MAAVKLQQGGQTKRIVKALEAREVGEATEEGDRLIGSPAKANLTKSQNFRKRAAEANGPPTEGQEGKKRRYPPKAPATRDSDSGGDSVDEHPGSGLVGKPFEGEGQVCTVTGLGEGGGGEPALLPPDCSIPR